jgi:transcriptional regulator with XRE-family HTH domain
MAKEADVGRLVIYGRRLRVAREAAHISQSVLAAAIGCRQPFISKAEAGDMMLRPYDYAVVARLLGTDLDALLGALTPAEEEEVVRMAATAASMAQQWRASSPDQGGAW